MEEEVSWFALYAMLTRSLLRQIVPSGPRKMLTGYDDGEE